MTEDAIRNFGRRLAFRELGFECTFMRLTNTKDLTTRLTTYKVAIIYIQDGRRSSTHYVLGVCVPTIRMYRMYVYRDRLVLYHPTLSVLVRNNSNYRQTLTNYRIRSSGTFHADHVRRFRGGYRDHFQLRVSGASARSFLDLNFYGFFLDCGSSPIVCRYARNVSKLRRTFGDDDVAIDPLGVFYVLKDGSVRVNLRSEGRQVEVN